MTYGGGDNVTSLTTRA